MQRPPPGAMRQQACGRQRLGASQPRAATLSGANACRRRGRLPPAAAVTASPPASAQAPSGPASAATTCATVAPALLPFAEQAPHGHARTWSPPPGRAGVYDEQGRVVLKCLTLPELEEWCAAEGEPAPANRALQLFRWMYADPPVGSPPGAGWARSLAETAGRQNGFSAKFIEGVGRRLTLEGGLRLKHVARAADGTRKLVFAVQGGGGGGGDVEAVIIPVVRQAGLRDRLTLCVSSQVGCAMNCQFCYTGRMGYMGSLSAAQIVEQVVAARRVLAEEGDRTPLTNLVFMGMGEPLANAEAVLAAADVMAHPLGLHMSHNKITISTVGLVPEMRAVAARSRVQVALSLHATTDEVRDWIVPINRRYNLAALTAALEELFPREGPLRRPPSSSGAASSGAASSSSSGGGGGGAGPSGSSADGAAAAATQAPSAPVAAAGAAGAAASSSSSSSSSSTAASTPLDRWLPPPTEPLADRTRSGAAASTSTATSTSTGGGHSSSGGASSLPPASGSGSGSGSCSEGEGAALARAAAAAPSTHGSSPAASGSASGPAVGSGPGSGSGAGPAGQGRTLLIEYTMLHGVNDTAEDAQRLADLLERVSCKVNLITFNPHAGTRFQPSREEDVLAFRSALIQRGYVCTIRDSRGDDEMAACGQLGNVGLAFRPAPILEAPERFRRFLLPLPPQ